MKNNESPEVVIYIRGRIQKRNATFDACQQARDRKSFQLMLELSDEAVTTRTRLRQMLQDHPLSLKLKDMNPTEAIGYLLVMTEQMTRWKLNRLSEKSAIAPRDKMNSNERLHQSNQQNTLSPGSDNATSAGQGASALELDDDTFDAFSSFTTTYASGNPILTAVSLRG